MATSPNFNWPEPDNTDLVKNGALAIRTAVDAIDTSMAELKGGTTGQVLSKTSATDMDFTWTTPSGGSNAFYAGKNKIINGDMNIWQRGTSFALGGSNVFTADRFFGLSPFGDSVTASQQSFTAGAAPVAGYESQYFLRFTRASGTSGFFLAQRIEDVRTFALNTVTLSFWAKASVGFTPINIYAQQNFGSGGSGAVTVNPTTSITAITTSWVRYTYTYNIPTVSGKTIGTGSSLEWIWNFNPGTASSSVDIWGVQVEAGSTATDFVTASGGSKQGELAMCQRYYYRQVAPTTSTVFGLGWASSTTVAKFQSAAPVTMRVAPTSVDYANLQLWDGGATYAVSALGLEYSSTNTLALSITSSSMTAYRPHAILSTSTSGYLGFSAEL
jgi:hypothetical protein